MRSLRIILEPIGIVRTDYSDEEVKRSHDGVSGVIEVYPEYSQGLYRLNGFSHIIVIAYFHKRKSRPLIIKPRGLLKYGLSLEELPDIGVFASDSPDRPNHLALSILKVTKIVKNRIYVENLDLYNGTPVLDIKPYTPSRAIDDYKLPNWYVNLINKVREKGFIINEI